jgi:two-component system, sensor histidine kinase RegB
LVAKELDIAMRADDAHKEDVELIRSQAARCREILQRLSNRSIDSETHLMRLPISSLIEEAIEPHRLLGVEIKTVAGPRDGAEPVLKRNPGIAHGLANLIENAVDFAAKQVIVESGWSANEVLISIRDDGPGFPADILDRIGEPYAQSRIRNERKGGGGLGLGLFITKTLLERSGASLSFSNRGRPGEGAEIRVHWPRKMVDAGPVRFGV